MSNIDDVKAATEQIHEQLTLITSDLSDAEGALAALLDARDAMIAQNDADINDLNNQLKGANATIATQQAIIDDLRAKLAAATTTAMPQSVPTPAPAPAPIKPFTMVLQNMTEVAPGMYRSNNLGAAKANGGQVAVAQARLSKAAQPGHTVVHEYDQTTNVVIDGTKNVKDWRAFTNPSNPYPNVWTGRGVGDGDQKLTAENPDKAVIQHSSHPTAWTNVYFPMPIKADVKQHIKRTLRISSAIGASDGYAKIEVDGKTVFEANGFIVDGPLEDFGAQIVWESQSGDSGPMPANAYLQIENVSLVVS